MAVLNDGHSAYRVVSAATGTISFITAPQTSLLPKISTYSVLTYDKLLANRVFSRKRERKREAEIKSFLIPFSSETPCIRVSKERKRKTAREKRERKRESDTK